MDGHKEIPDFRLAELCRIMSNGNALAKRVSQEILGKRKYRLFRMVLRGEETTLKNEQVQKIHNISESQKQIMLAVEGVRDELIEGHIALMKSCCVKAAKSQKGVDAEELFADATFVLIKAIYGYENLEVKFITYATKVLRTELQRVLLQNPRYGIGSHSSRYLSLIPLVQKSMKRLSLEGLRPDYWSIFYDLKAILINNNVCHEDAEIYLQENLPGIASTICFETDFQSDKSKKEETDLSSYIGDKHRLFDHCLENIGDLPDLSMLGEMERVVLQEKMQGKTVIEIAETLQCDLKIVRASLTKMRNKFKRLAA